MSAPKISAKSSDVNALVPELSYELALSELERIVSQMESGQMPLDASLEAYKRGNALLEFCQKSLAEVEQQVKILNDRQQLTPYHTEND